MLNQRNKYAPDVLDCIANLSNDEIFTSPKLANQMLDMVPQELFSNPRAKFLDPCCKSGVFLREIVKRLDRGLEDIIPDKQQRINHILHEQVFGIAITELTAQLSRRTVYCSKYACKIDENAYESLWEDNKNNVHIAHSYSISVFTDKDINNFCINPIQGNIRFNNKIKHTFDKDGICTACGASVKKFAESSHVYELIHMNEKRLEELKNMQWDLIISNPPYQMADSSLSASANPIYNIFVEQAKKLRPRYLVMIIPSRWMAGGKGLNQFRENMLNDKHITQLHDYINSKDCFSGVDIKGGVCYFLREADREAKCKIFTHNADGTKKSTRYLKEKGIEVFIRQAELIGIKEKVWKDTSQKSFADIVSVRKPYGFCTDIFSPTIQKEVNGKKQKVSVTSEEKYGLPTPSDTPIKDGYEIIGLVENKRIWKYVPKDYPFPKKNGLGKYKIFIPKAYGCGALGEVPSTPVLGTPVQACTETFVECGGWDTLEEATNALNYLKTKFFRCLVSIYKQTQDASNRIYGLVPMQNFTNESDIDWSKSVDEISHQLYKKYNLSDEDIAFIEKNISVMSDDAMVSEDVSEDEEQ